LVTTGKDADETKNLNYIGLVPVTIKAIQEQQTTIDTLQQRNAELDAPLAAVEQALQRLLEEKSP
jgi:hypothetical protein